MKKLFTVAVFLFCLTGVTFAQPFGEEGFAKELDQQSLIIVPENQHVTNKTAKVDLEYWPGTDKLRLYYTCHAVAFDQGEAMNTAIAVLKDFQEQNGYYSYKYLTRDSIKYYKDEKTGFTSARYFSYVKLAR